MLFQEKTGVRAIRLALSLLAGSVAVINPSMAQEVQKEIDRAEGKSWPMGSIERFAFYEHAKRAFCVVQTRERRFYGCFKFKMGVIPPEAKLGA